jgi:DNA-binding XRE family transcriptional regulator
MNTFTRQMESPVKEIKRLLRELKAWAKKRKHGAAAEIARAVGVERQTVTNWIAGRRMPQLKYWVPLQKFLDQKKKDDQQ